MFDKHVNLATPADVKMSIDGKEVRISHGVFCFSSTNGSNYHPTMHEDKKDYIHSKGKRIETSGSVVVEIIDTPDLESKESIDTVKKELKKSQDKAHPDRYSRTYVFLFSNPERKKIVELSFKGYVSDIHKVAPTKEGFITYSVTVVIFDQNTFKID